MLKEDLNALRPESILGTYATEFPSIQILLRSWRPGPVKKVRHALTRTSLHELTVLTIPEVKRQYECGDLDSALPVFCLFIQDSPRPPRATTK